MKLAGAGRIREARAAGPGAPDLLNLLAVVAPEPLPLWPLEAAAGEMPGSFEPLASSSHRDAVLAAFCDRGVARRDGDRAWIPGPVQEAVRKELVRPVALGAARAAAIFLRRAFEETGPRPAAERHRWSPFRPHVPAVVRRLAAAGEAPDRLLELAGRAGARLVDGGRVEEAERWLERAVALSREVRLAEPFLAAALEDQRAAILAELGREEEAVRAAESASSTAAEGVGPADPRLPLLEHNAGTLLKRAGRPAAARGHYEAALEVIDAHHGEENPLLLPLLLDLSEVRLATDDPGGAAEAARRALEVARARRGDRHPETAAALSRLGRSLREDGSPEGARAAFREAVEILERLRGPEAPSLATDLSYLGAVLEELGEVEEARGVHARALDILEAAFGPDHRLAEAAREHIRGL